MSQDTAAPAPAPEVQAPEVQAEEVVVYTVFAGNLSPQTTEDELRELFTKRHPVLKVNLVVGPKNESAFGFITFESQVQVDDIVNTYNKTDFGGREIRVEAAKRKPRRSSAPRERKPRQPKDEGTATDVKPRGNRRHKSKRKNRTATRNEDEVKKEDGAASTDNWGAAPITSPPANDSWNTDTNGANNTNGAENAKEIKETKGTKDAKEGTGRRPRRSHPRREVSGPPSKTTVHVKNLPYLMDDEGLKSIFADFKVVSAHVNRYSNSNRNKGYGFVELENEAEQLNAIEKLNGVSADGRKLFIRAARSDRRDEKETETKTEETKVEEASS